MNIYVSDVLNRERTKEEKQESWARIKKNWILIDEAMLKAIDSLDSYCKELIERQIQYNKTGYKDTNGKEISLGDVVYYTDDYMEEDHKIYGFPARHYYEVCLTSDYNFGCDEDGNEPGTFFLRSIDYGEHDGMGLKVTIVEDEKIIDEIIRNDYIGKEIFEELLG